MGMRVKTSTTEMTMMETTPLISHNMTPKTPVKMTKMTRIQSYIVMPDFS